MPEEVLKLNGLYHVGPCESRIGGGGRGGGRVMTDGKENNQTCHIPLCTS